MKEVKGIASLSYGDIACNAALLCVILYNTNFSRKDDLIQFSIAAPAVIIPLLYAFQLILMKRAYYRHRPISASAKVFLHICRIITLVYSLFGAFLLASTVYYSSGRPTYPGNPDLKFIGAIGLILVTVVMNFTIFFKGWRLLKLVKRPYLEEVMASFD